jgi:phage tail sheath protein FI
VFQANSGFSASDNITLSNYITALTAARKDAVGFVSPERAATVNAAAPATTVATWRTGCTSTSYGFADSSSLYVYDKYSDVYRWIAAAGSMAGLSANADLVADAWFSPAGFTRGNVRNVTKLAWNPNQAQRDALYKTGVNPIVTFPGAGTVLYGDKTLQSKPSAFDRINVRRLFIVLEKAISTASKASLFEFNDEFTRAQFRNMVEPFLRDVKGRRGITDFKVVCDGTNNTGNIIDTNKFVADIFVKPARSINYITLNFIATRTGVEFSEIAGGN